MPPIGIERKKVLLSFQKNLFLKFKSLELFNLALIHRSVSNEAGHHLNNERLEFLGDSILGAITATLLYENFANKAEGDMAKIKSVVVSEDVLSGMAREMQIDGVILLGRGEENTGGRNKNAILADALEAVIGALYLDSGYKAAFTFMSPYMKVEIERVLNRQHHLDYKSELQELSQHRYKSYPVYHLLKRAGSEHERYFWIEVTVNGKTYGPGMGKNKKTAEQEAARMAYEQVKG